jgi:glycosyltransferase involved in cell wall biosynthesis
VSTDESIILFGDYDYSYPRELTLRRGLRKNDIRVVDCNLSSGRILTGYKKIYLLFPSFVYLLYKYYHIDNNYKEVILIPRGNHLLIPFAKLLANYDEAQLVYDAFDPLYRTAVLRDENLLLRKIKYTLEYIAIILPDQLLVTNSAFERLYINDYPLSSEQCTVIEPGADEEKFHPKIQSPKSTFTVLYWGNFHRHHGIDTILDAASRLSEYDIKFELIGNGGKRKEYMNRAKNEALEQVEFIGRVDDDDLLAHINSSHVCLGVFSDHLLARCSITNKVFEAMAVGKPIITENSMATETIDNKAIIRVPPNSPKELAKSVLILKRNKSKRKRYSEQSRLVFEKMYSEFVIGKIFKLNIISDNE